MRHRFVVTYDIRDPKRLRKTFKVLRDFGDHLQLSVFECLLTPTDRIRLEDRLREVLNLRDDQVLFVNLGPAGDERTPDITALGVPYAPREIGPVIV